MNDLISRQAAIDELKKYIAVNKNPNHDARIWEEGMNCAVSVIGSLPSAQPEYYDYSDIDDVWEFYAEEQNINLTDGAKQLKDAMWVGYRKGKQDVQPEPQWIPCSERCPYYSETVIVSILDDIGDSNFNYTDVGWITHDGTWIVNNEENNMVTAWMPLPEPWRGEEHETD